MEQALHGDHTEQPTMRRLVALPGYVRLLGAYTLNELGWFIGTIALSVLVYQRTGSVLGSAGFFLCSQALPALVGPAIVGHLDRTSPRTLLPAMYWLEAALFGVLAWLTTRFALVPLLVIVVIDGVVALVARSIAVGARTQILKPVNMVREGGALQSIMFSIAYLIGPVLGGVITAFGGTAAALLVSCGLFAAMGVALCSRSIPRAIVHDGPARGRLRAALRYIRHDRPVATILVVQTIALVFFTIPTPIEVVYAVHTLRAGSAGYGVLLSVWGGGALLGSLAFTRWRHGSARVLIAVAIAMAAVGFAIMAAAPDLAIALVGAAAAGVSNGIGSVAITTELQDVVPQSWVAIVTSLDQSLGQLSPGVGIALGGVLAALASVRFALGVAAAGCAVLAALSLVALAPGRPDRERDAGGDAEAGDDQTRGVISGGEPAPDADIASRAQTLA
jgi:predicted MFS family arabinose efflux permease